MTETEALQYALDWLRAFPALPTAAPDYRERRAKVVERLEEMKRNAEKWSAKNLPVVDGCVDDGSDFRCMHCGAYPLERCKRAAVARPACSGEERGDYSG